MPRENTKAEKKANTQNRKQHEKAKGEHPKEDTK